MDLVHFIALGAGIGAAAAAEVIDMGAHDERRDVGIGFVAVRQHAEDVAAFFLLLLNDDVGGEGEAFAVDAAHEIAVVQLVLKVLELFASAGEELIAHGIGDADGGDAAGGEGGVKRERRELLHHFGIWAADDDETACAFLALSLIHI